MRCTSVQRVAVAALCLGALACRHQPEPATVWVSPDQAPPDLALVPVPLTDPAAMERLVESWTLLGADEEGMATLQQTARELPKARLQTDAAARRLVVLAVFRMVRGPGLAERFDAVRGLVDGLQAASPDAPETTFCRAFLRFILLRDDNGQLAAGGLERAVVADLERDLGRLVQDFPAFDGPGDWGRRRLATELPRVRALLAAMPVALPGAPTPAAQAGDRSPSAAP